MPSPTDDETPFPALSHTVSLNALDRSHLSPHDAFTYPLRQPYDGDGTLDPLSHLRHLKEDRSRSRRRKRAWKKLMWVKQSYQATFLENLQRNPRLKPYDFWPLVADSTVILQHVCSVILFIVCFVGIFQERVSPVSLVSGSSFATFLGWILWERWVSVEKSQEDEVNASGVAASATKSESIRRRARAASIRRPIIPPRTMSVPSSRPSSETSSLRPSAGNSAINIQVQIPDNEPRREALPSPSSTTSPTSPTSPLSSRGTSQNGASTEGQPLLRRASSDVMPDFPSIPIEANRLHQRLGTIKSALLIYCTLLGLSPILKSLTQSTSSDSIWAMSLWLLAINIFFFDYSGGVGAKFPASLSTNAALMASTVLASRLPSTKQVFCLTLFSIEVFGLFPVFRRHVQHRSFRQHAILTMLLILGAGWGVGIVIAEPRPGCLALKRGIGGMVVSVMIAAIATGGCSWWLIGLQRYKNEIRGPWDPARPIIMSRQRWEDR
ncbi:phosphatidylinositol n-acetylglucosaminyltransferase [Trichoderma arundinaceum]|uniref:Phosphatidylinositol n-acetylglucosaminyltransferase n=1 Tax=Trichoderma arundinaceum TaxID=490622 RepID=A0A395NFP9_TRIAR|nr:phosphatidylinositol n-acetylglucosaminyltransferase [Trichoderma arundinaceum]